MPLSRSLWMCSSRLKFASTWLAVTSPAQKVAVSKNPLAMSAAMASGMQAAEPFSPRMSSLHAHAAAARMALATSFVMNRP